VPGRHRGADDLDAQPADGGGTGAAGGAAGVSGRPALRGADHPAELGLPVRQGGNRTRWIIGGMAMLAAGALLAALAIPVLEAASAAG
jgi:hypothetical protein